MLRESLERLRHEGFVETILWVLEDNSTTRRFYERAGWRDDGGRKVDTWMGLAVPEARYRIALDRA